MVISNLVGLRYKPSSNIFHYMERQRKEKEEMLLEESTNLKKFCEKIPVDSKEIEEFDVWALIG